MSQRPSDFPAPKLRIVSSFCVCLAASSIFFVTAAQAADSTSILATSCFGCHNAKLKQGGLDLSTREGLLRGGSSGAAVVPGDARRSLLYRLVSHQQEPGMPFQSAALPKEAVSKIAEWIDAGAQYGEAAPNAGAALFAHVRPVLVAQCMACHGGGKTNRSGFDMSTREALLRGGDNGPAVVPGKAAESPLWNRIKHEIDPGMPYRGQKLADSVISKIGEWIDAGAPYDAPLKTEGAISSRLTSDHWAFQAAKRPAIPAVKNREWMRNPIDAFIATDHEKKGLHPLLPADKRVLLRRVYLDLIGLSPTPEQVAAFVADKRPDAYERTVDELLASPRYGERWGRHWMDVWRYSDWYGRREMDEQRNSARNIWRWRDWIIESLNEDKGYDRMIVEMLAADELYPNDPKALRATGYLARDYFRFNRNVWLQDAVEHTSAAFLGITMKCARCHDHKYDPISQEEYYRMRAFFETYDVRIDRVPGETDPNKDGIARIFDAEPRDGTPQIPAIYGATYRFIRGDETNPDKARPLSPAPPEVLSRSDLVIHPVTLPLAAYIPDIRPFVGRDLIAQAAAEIAKAEKKSVEAADEIGRAKRRLEGQDKTADAQAIGFDRDIKPIFERNCASCHNPETDKGGLSLDSPESILLGGTKHGPAAKPGKGEESPLVLHLRGKMMPRMPFGASALPDEQIRLVAQWIDRWQDDPRAALKRAEDVLALAEKELAWRRANLPAVEARVAADWAKYADPPAAGAEKLAAQAQQVETHANVLKAELDLLSAQQQLATLEAASYSKNVKEKRVAAARKAALDAAATLGLAADAYTPFAKPFAKTSSGRRTALANWIASKQNPLTARVAINHIWMRHFGKPLVPTVVNFGQNGKPPANQALLDWLSVQFMESNWSMKAMHRLMVTSNTYRMQSSAADLKHPNLAIDSANAYYWRMNPRRLEAETVRDSVLSLAGQLDTTMGGPDIDEEKAEQVHRRSLYFRHTPDSQVQFLKLFDQPDTTDCYYRTESIVPQQALALSNSRFTRTEARVLAARILERIGAKASDEAFIDRAFETVLAQLPSADERGASVKFLTEQTRLLTGAESLKKFSGGEAPEAQPSPDPHVRARENLVHALLNHTEFVTIR